MLLLTYHRVTNLYYSVFQLSFPMGGSLKYSFMSRRTPTYDNENKAEAVDIAKKLLQHWHRPDKHFRDIQRVVSWYSKVCIFPIFLAEPQMIFCEILFGEGRQVARKKSISFVGNRTIFSSSPIHILLTVLTTDIFRPCIVYFINPIFYFNDSSHGPVLLILI